MAEPGQSPQKAAAGPAGRMPVATTLLALSAVLLGIAMASGVAAMTRRQAGIGAAASAALSGGAALACAAVLVVAATHA